MADRRVKVIVEAAIDGFQAAMGKAKKSTEDLGRATDKLGPSTEQATSRFSKLSAAVEKHGGSMEKSGTALVGIGAGLTAMAVGAGKAAMDWESAWAGVTKTVDGSAEEMATLEGELRGLARTLPATHAEIAGVAEAAGQLGVAREDVAGFTKTMIDLSETTNLTADQAATSIAQFMNVMGTAGDDVDNLGAALVALGNDGASTEAEIMDMAQRLSGAGKLIGATESDVLALANALASVGVEAQLGGGALSRIMQRMYADVKEGGEGLQALAEVAGVSAQDFAAAFENDPVRAVAMLTNGLNGIKESGGNVIQTMADLGIKGTEETSVMLRLAGAGDLLTESLDLGAQAWAANTALAEEAEKRYETTEAKIAIAWNNIKDAAIDAGGALLPIVATFAEGAAGIAQAFAGLPGPVKSAMGVLAGVGGVAALALGGLLKLTPAAFETVQAFQKLAAAAPGAVGGLKTFGKVAGGLTIGVAAATGLVTVLTSLYNSARDATPEVQELANSLLKLGETGDMGSLDKLFQFDSVITNIDGFASAVAHMDLDNPVKHIQSFGDTVFGLNNPLAEARETMVKLDQTLATMDADTAAQQVDRLRQALELEGDDSLSHWNNLKEMFPEYAASVTEAANDTYGAVEDTDLLSLALGKVPPHLQAVGAEGDNAAAGAEAAGEGMGGAAEEAEALADALKEALDSLRDMGVVPRNAQAANDAYKQSLRDLNDALKENGKTLSDSTEKGLANRAAMRDLTDAGLENAAAMAEAGASQGEISAALSGMYEDLVASAQGFGLSKAEAESYAKELLGIPTDIDVDVASQMDQKALEIAELTGAAIGEIPDGINVLADMSDKAAQQAFKTAEAIKVIPGYKKVDVAVDDNGTPGQVQSRVNAITGKTEYVFVTDDGTVAVTQQKIKGIDGKTEYVYVSDDGTVIATQGRINNIKGTSADVVAVPHTSNAEAQLNHTARDRHSRIIATTIAKTIPDRTSMLARPVPRRAMGGRLPYTGLGTDQILGIGSHGRPTALVDDGEWVVRERSARKFDRVLAGINSDAPWVQHLAGYARGGAVGREWSASAVAPFDYGRLANVMGGQRATSSGMEVNFNGPIGYDPREVAAQLDMSRKRAMLAAGIG